MRPLTIAFLKTSMQGSGGLEKYTLRLAQRFAFHGHRVFILTSGFRGALDETVPISIINVAEPLSFSLYHLWHFDRCCQNWLERNPVDIVFGLERHFCKQTHYRAGNGVHAAYLDMRKQYSSFFKRLSFSMNPLHYLIKKMEKETYESKTLKKLFTNSYMVADEIISYYPKTDPKKIMVVHNGVEWEELQSAFDEIKTEHRIIQESLGLDSGKTQFLFVGHEYLRKGLSLLLHALRSLQGRDFELSVVGKERNMDFFKNQARRLGLQNQVHFFGAQKEIKKFYQAADTLVVPSLYDPFANVTVEGLAMGLYVVSSNKNGGSEVIKTADQGLVFDDLQNPDGLASCLQQAMLKPKTDIFRSEIRASVSHLSFKNQLEKIVSATINT